jgi:hypothetical protein
MRRLSTVRALLVVAVSLVAGATTGVAGHALTGTTSPPAGAPSGAPSPGAAPSRSAFLGAGNVLAAGDFAVLGWHDLVVDSEGNGEPQFAYACQREQLSATGYPTGIISATWSSPRTLSGAEVVAQLGNAPQTRSLFAMLVRWHEHCTPGGGGSGPVTPSTPLDTVRTSQGAARIWRVTDIDERHPTYVVVARGRDRIGLVDLYSDPTPPDPSGLRSLARKAIDRLG